MTFGHQFVCIIIIVDIIIGIICDCGFPALPVHMKVRPFTSVYYEDDIVQYYCEYKDMHLIGNDKRQCSQSRWKGDIPHCVRELPRHSLDRIEMVDIKNHTISKTYGSAQMYYNPNNMRDNDKYQKMTYYGNYDKSPNECIHSKVAPNVTSLEWKVVFKRPASQVYHVEVVIYNQNIGDKIDLHKTESVIETVFVSNYRQCEPQKVEMVEMGGKLFKYSFHCELKNTEINQNFEDMSGLRFESLNNITINFALNEVTVCELHISETLPFRSYSSGSCGSPDVPLFANYSPVFDEITQSPIPVGYTYDCEQGFYLKGNPVILCAVNNKWFDEFPTCIPNESCHLINKSRLNELSLSVTYNNLYSFDKNISAINGSQAIFSCNKLDKNDKNRSNKTLIGDSIRFCQINGNWSGEEPVCLDENDFTLYLAELNEDILQTESKLPKFAQHLHRLDECHVPAIPKYAKVYTYDAGLLNVYMANIKERIDLMPTYANGSVITYHCDSKFSYMASDFDARTCINGSWVGNIGKCYSPVGGTYVTRAASIQVQYKKSDTGFPDSLYHPLSSENDDAYWNYLETDNTKCVSIDIKSGIELSLNVYLSNPVRVSYFAIRLGAKNIFHELDENMLAVHRASQLKSSPITASIDHFLYGQKSECEVTKVIETGAFDVYEGLTMVSFKCDETESVKSNQIHVGPQGDTTKANAISINLDPNEFHDNFNSTNITFCGLMIFESSDDCGLPENVPNSEIISSHNSGDVRYRCKNGYKLIGSEYVRCSKYGTWKDPFPRCELYKLCDMKKENSSETLQRKYYNTLVMDNEEVAVLGTITEFECRIENINQGLHIMIGPRTSVCAESGQWSVKEPICADDKYFIRESISPKERKNNDVVIHLFMFIGLTVISITIIITVILVYRRYGCSNPLVTFVSRRKLTRSSTTFISYGQSSLRDSVLSFNDELSVNSHSTA